MAPPSTFSGRQPSQSWSELTAFIQFLLEKGVRRYLEIGARHGDTFHAVMDALGAGSYGVAVDLPGAAWGKKTSVKALQRACEDLRIRGITCRSVIGNSQSAETVALICELAPFDAVLIDGDHRYEPVSQDYAHYGPMGRYVAFHDIVGEGQSTKDGRYAVEVPRLWAELKAVHPHVEFVAPGSKMGIGVILPASSE